MRRLSLVAVFALFLGSSAACSTESNPIDVEAPDADTPSGQSEGGTTDGPDGSSSTLPDGGDGDSGTDGSTTGNTAILGTLTGACGVVAAALGSPTSSTFDNDLVFVPSEMYARSELSTDGQKVFDDPNAGGTSIQSEVMSFEVLHYCEGASLLKTETEITYQPGPGAITDTLVEIAGKKVGVSVTRAYRPSNIAYPDADMKGFLEGKLNDIKESSSRVKPADKWVKQILHVFIATQREEDSVTRVLPTIDAATKGDTIILLTRTTGGGFVYCEPDPPLGSECPPVK